MRYRCLLGVALALLIGFGGPAARAQTSAAPSGPIAWYLGAEGGWTSLEQQQDRIPGTPFPQNWKSGFNVGARTGYENGPWRFEEEFRRFPHHSNVITARIRDAIEGDDQL